MSKLILLSDIHLENKSQESAIFVLNSINEKIALEKKLGNNPIVVLAGDIHNGTKGYEWMSKINAQIIYVAGNHEYWGGDFYEVNEDLQKNSPKNVSYLYNKALHIGETIFLGSTLWTDVAEKTNPDISHYCTFVMNDIFKSTAKKWYENPANIDKLKKLTSRADEFISEKRWNILIEREENKKTQRFYNAFNAIYYFFTEYIKNEKSHLNYDLEKTHMPISQADYEKSMNNLLAFNSDIDFKDYMQINNNFKKTYGNDSLPKELLMENEFLDELFKQFKNVALDSKRIVVVSHHLPFMEEILIGNHRSLADVKGSYLPKLLNELNENIFLINEGQSYPFHNYFWQCSKGEIAKNQDMTKIAHYFNSGSKMFESSFLKKVDVWLHGHEHHYNFIDYLKGIKIATNPMGYALHGLNFENGVPVINKSHLGDKEKEQEWSDYIKKVKKDFIQEVTVEEKVKDFPSCFYSQQAVIWSWYLWNKESYSRKLKEATYLNKKIHTLISKRVQEKKYDLFQIKTYALALNSLIDNLTSQESKLSKAISARVNVDFSYQSNAFGLNLDKLGLGLHLDLMHSKKVIKLNSYALKEESDSRVLGHQELINEYGFRELFYNSVQFAYTQRKIDEVTNFFKGVVLNSPQDVSISLMQEFNEIQKELNFNDSYKLDKKIEKRYNALIIRLKKKAPEKSNKINISELDF